MIDRLFVYVCVVFDKKFLVACTGVWVSYVDYSYEKSVLQSDKLNTNWWISVLRVLLILEHAKKYYKYYKEIQIFL